MAKTPKGLTPEEVAKLSPAAQQAIASQIKAAEAMEAAAKKLEQSSVQTETTMIEVKKTIEETKKINEETKHTLLSVMKDISSSVGKGVRNTGNELFANAFPGLKGLIQKDKEESKDKGGDEKTTAAVTEMVKTQQSTNDSISSMVEQQKITNQLLEELKKNSETKSAAAEQAKTAPVLPGRDRYEYREKAGLWADTHKGVGGGQFVSRKEAEKLGLGKGGEKAESAAQGGLSSGLAMERLQEAVSRNGDKIDTSNGYLKDIADHLTTTKPQPQAKKEEGGGLLSGMASVAGTAMDLGKGAWDIGKGLVSGGSKAIGSAAEGVGNAAKGLFSGGSKAAGAAAEVASTAGNAAQGVSKWSKFLTFMEKTAPSLFKRFMVRAGSALAGLALPGPGWIWTAVSVLGSLSLAYEVYELWKDFSSQKDEDKEKRQPIMTAMGDFTGTYEEKPQVEKTVDQEQAGRNNLKDKGDFEQEKPKGGAAIAGDSAEVVNKPAAVPVATTAPSQAIMQEQQRSKELSRQSAAEAEKMKQQREMKFEADVINFESKKEMYLKAEKIIFSMEPVKEAKQAAPAGAPPAGGGPAGEAAPAATGGGVAGGAPVNAPTPIASAAPSTSPVEAATARSQAAGGLSGGAASPQAAAGGGAVGSASSAAIPQGGFGAAVKGTGDSGLLPDSALAPIGQGKHRAQPPAAAAFKAMREAAKADGVDLSVTDSYRSYAEQVDVKRRKPTLAATPGKSNHGWGLAFDMAFGSNRNSPGFKWMAANAAKFGITGPLPKPDEPWHWTYTGGGDPKAMEQAKQAGKGGAAETKDPLTAVAGEAAPSGGGGGGGGAPAGGAGGGAPAGGAPASPAGGGAPPPAAPAPAAPTKGAELAQASTNDIVSQRDSGSAVAGTVGGGNDSASNPAKGSQDSGRFDKENVGNVEPADAAKRLKELFGIGMAA